MKLIVIEPLLLRVYLAKRRTRQKVKEAAPALRRKLALIRAAKAKQGRTDA